MPRFPTVPLPVVVSIAPGGEPAADPDDWEPLWTEITDDVRVAQGITITGGRGDEANQVDASQCRLTVDNRSGDYSPRNPLGQWYGRLRKNTPIKVEVRRGADTFGRTVTGSWGTSDAGNTWPTVDTASTTWTVSPATGAVVGISTANFRTLNQMGTAGGWNTDVRMLCSLPVVPAGGPWVWGVTLRRVAAVITNYLYVWARFQPTGAIDVVVGRRDGASIFSLQTAAGALAGYTADRKVWIRARSIGTRTQGKIWYDGDPEPAAWQVSFTESSPDLTWDAEKGTAKLSQAVGAYMMREAGNTNTTSGNLWSFHTSQTVFIGTVVEWPVRWDKSGNDCTAPVTASGVLRRLQQGASPLTSPIYRTVSAHQPWGYWPLEDDSGADTAVGVGADIKPATVYGAGFGFAGPPLLGGATATVDTTADTTIAAVLPRTALTGNAWLGLFFLYTPALPPAGVYPLLMRIPAAGTVTQWQVRFSSDLAGTVYIVGFDTAGNQLLNVGQIASFTAGAWHAVQVEAYQDGPNVSTTITAVNLATGVQTSASDTTAAAATIGAPTGWALYGDSTGFPEGSVGHVAFFDRRNVFTAAELRQSGQGYAGETCSARVARLCAEQGVAIELLGAATTRMGPQRSDTFLNLLRECATSDLGVLYETNHTPGLGYRPRTARYNTAARFALDFAAGHVAEAPEPTDDDRQVRNDWTVSRPGGSSARAVDENHVAAQGRYDDSAEINTSTDDVLGNHAAIRVYLGTRDELRWPQITLDLARNYAFLADWLSTLVGSRFTITGTPVQLPGTDVDVLVEGWTQTLTPFGWDVELNCSPATPWARFPNLAAAGAPTATDARLDSSTSTLNAAVTAAATSIVVDRNGGQPWGADVPYDLVVAGERMTVTAAGPAVDDDFTRTVVAGWGTSTIARAWTTTGGAAADYSVQSGRGLVALGSVNVSRYCLQSAGTNPDLTASVATDVLAVGGSHFPALVARYADGSNNYLARLEFDTAAQVTLSIRKRVAGVETELVAVATGLTHAAGARYTIRFALSGSTLQAKAWPAGAAEPPGWQLTVTDTSLTTAGQVGMRSILSPANTNPLPVTASWDDYAVNAITADRLTVTRAVNGVAKAQLAGQPVSLWTPAYAAL